jgi:protein-L-isoaspartate O-methyltransferase
MDKTSPIEKLKPQDIAWVTPAFLDEAYENYPLPIGHEQSIIYPLFGDGHIGWPKEAPFDGSIACPTIAINHPKR